MFDCKDCPIEQSDINVICDCKTDCSLLEKWLKEHDKKVRAEGIEEAIKIADCAHTDCWDCAFGEADICKLQQFYGQLKEQADG